MNTNYIYIININMCHNIEYTTYNISQQQIWRCFSNSLSVPPYLSLSLSIPPSLVLCDPVHLVLL